MSNNIKIKNIEIYHPLNKVGNDFFIKHFNKQGKDIGKFLKYLGKEERYRINNPEENGLTMAIEASRKVLASANLKMSQIDMILYTTQVPEYSVPTNASMLHRALDGGKRTRMMDLNATCSGMLVAVEQASVYMRGNKRLQRVLVVGSDYLTSFANPETEVHYAGFGDAACAVILERTEEETGFIDAVYRSNSNYANKLLFPAEGMNRVLQGKEAGRYVQFAPFDISFGEPITDSMIEELLEVNDVKIEDINAFCFSQLAYSDSTRLSEKFNIPMEKIMYIGDKYGYTGTTSPMIGFYEGVKNGHIQRGDTVLFWTVGAGHQFIAMLFKY